MVVVVVCVVYIMLLYVYVFRLVKKTLVGYHKILQSFSQIKIILFATCLESMYKRERKNVILLLSHFMNIISLCTFQNLTIILKQRSYICLVKFKWAFCLHFVSKIVIKWLSKIFFQFFHFIIKKKLILCLSSVLMKNSFVGSRILMVCFRIAHLDSCLQIMSGSLFTLKYLCWC